MPLVSISTPKVNLGGVIDVVLLRFGILTLFFLDEAGTIASLSTKYNIYYVDFKGHYGIYSIKFSFKINGLYDFQNIYSGYVLLWGFMGLYRVS